MLKLVPIEDLKTGMFVNRVTRQTAQLKIKTQGLIKDSRLISKLKERGIQEVEVDLSRSILMDAPEVEIPAEEPKAETKKAKPQKKSDAELLSDAHNLYSQAKVVQSKFFKRIRKGAQVKVTELMSLSHNIMESVFENPNALSCLTLIKDKNDYLLEHSLNCSILMGLFARHLGFDRQLIDELGQAGMLMDVGMATMPDELMDKPALLDAKEHDKIRTHVFFGVDLVQKSGEGSTVILDVIANHHERLDGSGYPNGKQGDELSVYARMAAIVDTYDSLTSDRPWRKAMSPTQSLKSLLSSSQGKLDQSLVQQFIRCLGVHPVGSLVKLKSGKLAIVTRLNKEDPLSPVVMTFYSVRLGTYSEVKQVDLGKVQDSIESSVRPEEFKLNLPKFFKEVFLQQLG
ncbi:HD-GYP domain-containing protein [Bowmanella dokdonensis]|uniref:HD-GYP domain-containing protein n=1 Tax=Bowmanella dokdonensis TaxID=751969 RepID=A0A939DPN3_9ALTE|nr:HD-GYP domain-containing protein [Bowmanella dokdonensis]MBN7826475.1 HD-GYP domain-containing protein [Bowmanella dokdonensis]